MNYKEKYGEWGLILGATEGIGKAFAEGFAEKGMNVVLVGRRTQKLETLGKEISQKYNVEHLIITADFAKTDSFDLVSSKTKNLDIGLMSYIACFHTFGKLQDTPWEAHEQMLNVNILTFLKFFYHYMNVFSKRDKGAIINVSSLTGITSSPYNAQYGAGKAYILKLTEAVAYEALNTGVDVEVITCGFTTTPSALRNLPGGPEGEKAINNGMTPEEVVKEALENLGVTRSVIAGNINKSTVHHLTCDMSADDAAAYMGSFYEN